MALGRLGGGIKKSDVSFQALLIGLLLFTKGGASAEVLVKRNCFLDLMNPPGGNMQLAADGRTPYVLINGPRQFSLRLIKVDYEAAFGRELLTLPLTANLNNARASLVAYAEQTGDYVTGHQTSLPKFTAVLYESNEAACYTGPSQLHSSQLSSSQLSSSQLSLSRLQDQISDRVLNNASETEGYEIFETPGGRGLMQLSKRQILGTRQEDVRVIIPPRERPLFFDAENKILITWNEELRTLFDREPGAAVAKNKLILPHDARLVQQKGAFMVVHLDHARNQLTLEELTGWAGAKKTALTFNIQLPAAYPVAAAGMSVDIKHHIALITGANLLAKQRWQKLFVVDFGTGKILAGLAAEGRTYIHQAQLINHAKAALYELRDPMNGRTLALKIFDVIHATSKDVELEAPTKH